jgi:hypothetical protein
MTSSAKVVEEKSIMAANVGRIDRLQPGRLQLVKVARRIGGRFNAT